MHPLQKHYYWSYITIQSHDTMDMYVEIGWSVHSIQYNDLVIVLTISKMNYNAHTTPLF